jgi:hypothetical protein
MYNLLNFLFSKYSSDPAISNISKDTTYLNRTNLTLNSSFLPQIKVRINILQSIND